jgi:hypothetical protein
MNDRVRQRGQGNGSDDDSRGSQDSPLASLDCKLQLIRDRTQGVAEGYGNGLYLWGEGGTSKSYTVVETLKQLGKPYRVSNSRLTPKGLFLLLRDNPDMVHVLEDMETLLAERHAAGVLRSALWGQQHHGRQERLVVWQTATERAEVSFTGGIILIANRPLDDLPELRALATRIPSVHYQPTNEEIAALMRKVAAQGYPHGKNRLTPEDCLEVAEAIIERTARLEKRLDMRLLVNTFLDRLQWANGASETHWHDLLESRMKERALPGQLRESRSERKHREQTLARRLAALPRQERLSVWKAETGKSQAALYRRLDELKSSPELRK